MHANAYAADLQLLIQDIARILPICIEYYVRVLGLVRLVRQPLPM